MESEEKASRKKMNQWSKRQSEAAARIFSKALPTAIQSSQIGGKTSSKPSIAMIRASWWPISDGTSATWLPECETKNEPEVDPEITRLDETYPSNYVEVHSFYKFV